MDERQLITKILAGDADAERQLYDTHVDRVYRLAYRMTREGDLAEDMTQDTFIRAFERLAAFRGDGPFGGWLHRIATSVIFSALRKRKRVRQYETTDVDLELLNSAGSLDQRNWDLGRRLDEAINNLDLNHRMVFVMHDYEGFTHGEIAQAMDTPVGTAKARLSRAREKLRVMLSDAENPAADMEMES